MALGLAVILSAGALTVDLGYARVVRQQLQNAADAAALAGSARLDGTDEGMASARAMAVNVASLNLAAGAGVALDSNEGNDPNGDVVLGSWDDESGTFNPSDDPLIVDTVQVRARIGEVRTFLAEVTMGRDSLPVGAASRARVEHGGTSAVECYIPLAIPDCLVETNGVDGLQDLTLSLNPPSLDSVGWARANGMPSGSWSRDQIENDCEEASPAEVGDPVGVQNGNVQAALEAIADRVRSSTTVWDPALWGELPRRMTGSAIPARDYGVTYEGAIIVFDGGDEYCEESAGQFNGTHPLKGFVWASIYDVRTRGNSADRTLKLRLDTSREHSFGTEGGGPDYGVVAGSSPRMVRMD